MEKKEYFDKEEEFLSHIFKNENKFLSKTKIEGVLNLNPELLLEKNFTLEYCDIKTYEDKFSFTDAIFRNKSEIFIYLSKRDVSEMNYKITIYFEPQKLEETKFFIKNLLKLK